MRARRLRRLGLSGGDITMTPTSSTDTAITNPPQLTDNIAKTVAAKNILCPDTEHDENQHKQKQQKIDNEVNMEIGLNNNEAASDKSGSQHLTQRSRLLDEIDKQRIENKLNQNNKETTETEIEMEAEDNSPNNSAAGDSGIENMETDELPTAIETALAAKAPADRELTYSDKVREAEICMSRILDVFWNDYTVGNNKLTEAIVGQQNSDLYNEAYMFDDVAFDILTEVVRKYFSGKIIDFKASGDETMEEATSSTNAAEQMDTGETSCMAPNLKPHNLPDHGSLVYLIAAYLRSCNEQERYNSDRNRQKFDLVVLEAIGDIKVAIVHCAKLLLNGTLSDPEVSRGVGTHPLNHRSALLKLLYDDAVPSDFLCALAEQSYKSPKIFDQIFGTVLRNLVGDMQSRIISKNIDTSPINVLKQLLDITISSNIRPVCGHLVGLVNFCPSLVTPTPGREVVKLSYLGAFLSLSVFSDENPKLAEDVDDNWEATFGNTLRMVSQNTRSYLVS